VPVCGSLRDVSRPELTVVLIMQEHYASLQPVVTALLAQGPPGDLEVVVVSPDASAAALDEEALARFGRWKRVSCGPIRTTGQAMAAGFRAATCEWVAYCEDHSLPDPGWAASRLDAHRAGAAAVGSVLRNGNPARVASRAFLLQSFGPYVWPAAGGTTEGLPWHQCSYERALLPQGPELEILLEVEGLLHERLLAGGHSLCLESRAMSRHFNPDRLRDHFRAAWLGGRAWGGLRALQRRSGIVRRVAWAALTPVVIVVRWSRSARDVARVAPPRPGATAAALAGGLAVHAVGESLGSVLGVRSADEARTDLELNRWRYLENPVPSPSP
jgi:hypothetical protein